MHKTRDSKNDSVLNEYVVLDNQEISPDVHVISFNRDFDFIPGQVLKIAVDRTQPPRIYSICSGNKEKVVRVLFNIKEEGYLTPKLSALIPGDSILVSKPYGSFLGIKEPAWFIATGTGIAPFYSMLCSGMAENKTLIHGVRFLNQFYFEDELEYKLGRNYIRCCSRESSCNVVPGRVSDYLKSVEGLPDTKYFLCGSAIMVVEIRDLLIEMGILYENILAEIYF